MFLHLKRAAWAASLTVSLTSGVQAEPPPVQGLVGKPQTASETFQDESAAFETRKLDGGALLHVAPGARIHHLHTTRLWLSGAGKTPTHVFQLDKGRVDVTIPPERANRVAVLLVGPKGNSGVVHQGHGIVVAEHDAVSFAAIDGSMLTGRGSTWKKLSAGASRVVDLERGDTVESAQLGAPSVGLSKPLQIAFPGDGSHTQVKLTPVRGAERYQVALFRSVGNGRERVEQLESRGPTATLSSQTPGKYSVVARALDRFGVPGHASAPESLRVIGVGLPEGARAESSTVLLPPNRRLSLVGVDGLLMTYGAGNHFVAAPSSVAMSRGAATRVRFRDPTSTREVSLNLIPHWVKANVSVGPKTARWPEDRVVFTVQLSDALGRPANVEDGVDVRVTVNLEPVHVDWKHEGSRLRGHVDAPRNSKGPWVVRVEVLREGAGVIGRDFLEVIESRAKPEPDAGTRRAEIRK